MHCVLLEVEPHQFRSYTAFFGRLDWNHVRGALGNLPTNQLRSVAYRAATRYSAVLNHSALIYLSDSKKAFLNPSNI